MKIDWNFIALLLGVITGVFSISSTLWKIANLLILKAKAQDARDRALYENLKIQASRIEDIMDYLSQDSELRGQFFARKSLKKLQESAFKDFDEEHTGFS